MTRNYALLKLLEHGPLSIGQIEHITCWSMEDCRDTVTELRSTGQIVSVNRTAVYALAAQAIDTCANSAFDLPRLADAAIAVHRVRVEVVDFYGAGAA